MKNTVWSGNQVKIHGGAGYWQSCGEIAGQRGTSLLILTCISGRNCGQAGAKAIDSWGGPLTLWLANGVTLPDMYGLVISFTGFCIHREANLYDPILERIRNKAG